MIRYKLFSNVTHQSLIVSTFLGCTFRGGENEFCGCKEATADFVGLFTLRPSARCIALGIVHRDLIDGTDQQICPPGACRFIAKARRGSHGAAGVCESNQGSRGADSNSEATQTMGRVAWNLVTARTCYDNDETARETPKPPPKKALLYLHFNSGVASLVWKRGFPYAGVMPARSRRRLDRLEDAENFGSP